jgi:hypothetical protein
MHMRNDVVRGHDDRVVAAKTAMALVTPTARLVGSVTSGDGGIDIGAVITSAPDPHCRVRHPVVVARAR